LIKEGRLLLQHGRVGGARVSYRSNDSTNKRSQRRGGYFVFELVQHLEAPKYGLGAFLNSISVHGEAIEKRLN